MTKFIKIDAELNINSLKTDKFSGFNKWQTY